MITLYTEKESSRLTYICKHIFTNVLGHEFHITTDPSEKADLRYATSKEEGALTIIPYGLLFEKGIRKQEVEATIWEGTTALFPTPGDVPFDIFSASFYLLSRYEEYTAEKADRHGRFLAEESAAYQYHFLEEPIIDQWANLLLSQLKGIGAAEHPRKYTYIPTIDVDNVFAFRNHGLLQTAYCLLRDKIKGKDRLFKLRLNVVLRKQADPYFNLQEVADMHQGLSHKPMMFYHCGCFGKRDKRVMWPSRRYKKVRQALESKVISGLHPSYNSSTQWWRFKLENGALQHCLSKSVTEHCRFHYLRFNLPDTYEKLIEEGFQTDWSLCYSNDPGFRASTSFPFNFYNLERDEERPLLLYPTVVMDKSLRNNLGLTLEESEQYINRLGEKVKAVNGQFITLFHNEHLTDEMEWKGWKELYQHVIDHQKREI